MFVRGDDDVKFAYIADVIDIGRAANVDHIGLMTPKIQAGPVRFRRGCAGLAPRERFWYRQRRPVIPDMVPAGGESTISDDLLRDSAYSQDRSRRGDESTGLKEKRLR